MEYYNVPKKINIMPFAAAMGGPKDSILFDELSQTERNIASHGI